MSYSILIVDDHPLMAQATKVMLEQLEDIQVIGISSTGQECMNVVGELNPDLVLLDYLLPDMAGTDVCELLKKKYPDIKIVIFTGMETEPLLPKFLEIHASGVISKGMKQETIKHIIYCVLAGNVVIPQSGLQLLSRQPLPTVEVELNTEEAAIMNMIMKGYTQEQIADQIHMSKRSVDNYQRRIYEKMGVRNRVQAIETFVRSKYYSV
ncbi:response regulator transcription factor [Paenibacillus sp. YN15]|uniref:response regulator n=1 Tax=Paenibacillus sp. YN15 TaxID=1742774 RepID=UPI000DCC37EE|nr:response regulator transcription factor [Paenibacillus sp. YN15]RAV02391.1 DNA-binding response regulator [Paenibacillus sp. YN15]